MQKYLVTVLNGNDEEIYHQYIEAEDENDANAFAEDILQAASDILDEGECYYTLELTDSGDDYKIFKIYANPYKREKQKLEVITTDDCDITDEFLRDNVGEEYATVPCFFLAGNYRDYIQVVYDSSLIKKEGATLNRIASSLCGNDLYGDVLVTAYYDPNDDDDYNDSEDLDDLEDLITCPIDGTTADKLYKILLDLQLRSFDVL